MVVRSIVDFGKSYYQQFPSDVISKVLKSSLYTFTVTFVLTKGWSKDLQNLAEPLVAVCVASLASVIYSFTNPFFNLIFKDNHLRIHRELMKQIVNITISSLIIHYYTTSKINFFAISLIGSLSMNLIKSSFHLIPSFFQTVLNDEKLADETRDLLDSVGLGDDPGSSSVFINFGRMQPIF